MKFTIRSLFKPILLLSLISIVITMGVAQTSQAAEPIKIGVVLSLTGWGGFLGTPEKMAITGTAEEVNKKGGLFGRPIEVFFEDD